MGEFLGRPSDSRTDGPTSAQQPFERTFWRSCSGTYCPEACVAQIHRNLMLGRRVWHEKHSLPRQNGFLFRKSEQGTRQRGASGHFYGEACHSCGSAEYTLYPQRGCIMNSFNRALSSAIVLVLLLVSSPTLSFQGGYATCYGHDPCNACKNCKYCGHCAKRGGTCGVCKR